MRTMLHLVALQAVPPRDSIAVAADLATVVIGAAVLILLLMTGLLFARLYRALGEMRIGVRQNLGPVSDRARAISDNVEYVTQVVRSDVESLNASVSALGERLTAASERMEERIEEFNALMDVVQGEAEDLLLDTAATVRGVRESARSIAAGRGRARSARASSTPTEGGPGPTEPALESAPEVPEDETDDPVDGAA